MRITGTCGAKVTLTVKLDPDLEKQFESACRRQRATKSAVVTDLVRAWVTRQHGPSSYEVAMKLGVVGSDPTGPRDAAAKAKKYLRRAIGAKLHL
jgi:hypothetical protein